MLICLKPFSTFVKKESLWLSTIQQQRWWRMKISKTLWPLCSIYSGRVVAHWAMHSAKLNGNVLKTQSTLYKWAIWYASCQNLVIFNELIWRYLMFDNSEKSMVILDLQNTLTWLIFPPEKLFPFIDSFFRWLMTGPDELMIRNILLLGPETI